MHITTNFRSPVQFKKLFGRPCTFGEEILLGFKFGYSLRETPLCTGYQRYIFPKVAQNTDGKLRYIVNTDEYRQGVTVEECQGAAEGKKLIRTFISLIHEDLFICIYNYKAVFKTVL